MNSLDLDGDGYVRYREFVRRTTRHGVKSRTSEEQIIYLFVTAMKRSGQSM